MTQTDLQASATPKTIDILLHGERFSVVAPREKTEKFWKKAQLGKWEADTFQFIRKHASADAIFLDIGAWIGPMSMYASRFAGRVLSFEPDPVAFRDLSSNIQLNSANVEVINAGVDRVAGHLTLYAPGGLGQSITSSLKTDGAEAIKVPTITFAEISQRLSGSNQIFAKVDIEGHEYNIIDALIEFVRRHQSPLHLSLHPRTFYESAKDSTNFISAKIQTWKATKSLIEALAPLGVLTVSDTGCPMTTATLFQYIFLRTRVRNFTIEVRPTVDAKL